ncbi:hypothetical protein KAT21_03095 [Candidatus Bathyarchaeota archaeon]|nr:hypothetical protein [Candidatus Bathyarchaeota archaeon]
MNGRETRIGRAIYRPVARAIHREKSMVEYVNIPIPKLLFKRLTKSLKGSGYRSTTEYMIYLIRRNLPNLESKNMEKRLKALGYIS